MLGKDHALSGAAAGAFLSGGVFHASTPVMAATTILTAGAALLPDLDHQDATVSHTYGFLTGALSWIVVKVSGGHRHLTHSLLGAGAATGLALAAEAFRATAAGKLALGFIIALLLASAMRALRLGGHKGEILAIGGASAMIYTGWGLALVPVIVGAGCLTHIAGDMLTDSGCPVLAPLSKRDYHLLPEPFAFTTGTLPETMVVRPLLILSIVAAFVLETGLWAATSARV